MDVTLKDASITNTDDEGPGSFRVVLSTPAKDRDGDELATEDWKQPLPTHITFDVDHGMSVEKTVGSGTPSIDDQGRLIVDGTYSSLPNAQNVRTLVKEGHIRTVSVAFMTEKVTKDGKSKVQRELLNGAFVAIPSNREAVVLEAKSLLAKAGARNSASDQARIQAIYEHAVALGAGPSDDSGAAEGAVGGKAVRMVATKAVGGSFEERQRAIDDALSAAYPGDDQWAYSIATFDDSVVYRVSGGGMNAGQWQASYTFDGATVSLGDPERVSLVESVVPLKSFRPDTKAAMDDDDDPGKLAQAVDAALDEAQKLIDTVDASTLPEPIQQALGLVTAAEESVDELLDVLGVPDPDEPTEDDTTDETTEKSAPAAATAAPAAGDDAELVDLQNRALALEIEALAAG